MSSMSTVGFTSGVFDLFHVGHLNLLRNARARCDHLVVGVNSDALSISYKSKKPVIPEEERLEIVKSIRYVDAVILLESVDKVDAWEQVAYNVLFVGDDWKGHPRWVSFEKRLEPLGARVEYLPYTTHTSSTALREALAKL